MSKDNKLEYCCVGWTLCVVYCLGLFFIVALACAIGFGVPWSNLEGNSTQTMS